MQYLFLLLMIHSAIAGFSQNKFQKYFKPQTFRFDFLLGGDSETTTVYPVQMKKEKHWGGTRKNQVSPFNYGSFRYRIFDKQSDEVIFSKGFSPLFHEWQATTQAKTEKQTFYNVITSPFPRKEFRLQIEKRNWEGQFEAIYSKEIQPNDYFILDELPQKAEVTELIKNGPSAKKMDIAVLAEGYTSYEKDKFIQDATRLVNDMFEVEPFKSMKEHFNVHLVHSESSESGTDIPGEHIYKNTVMDFSFYTFDEPRYLTTNNLEAMYDIAANVPYDQVYVLINSETYGGGGFYNFYNSCTSDNERSSFVFVHEFGHGFGGLGDEYYTSSVPVDDFYNLEIEPWEPNITTLVDFDSKWKHLIEESIPVPTPRKTRYAKDVGAFEGGGYYEKGMYSPMMDCIMKSSKAPEFCKACQEAIREMILYYSE